MNPVPARRRHRVVLKSGWSSADSMDDPPATRTPTSGALLQPAENGAVDVLLVGYTSRFLRDAQLTLYYHRSFHRNGVVILIGDDRILTSDPNESSQGGLGWRRLVGSICIESREGILEGVPRNRPR